MNVVYVYFHRYRDMPIHTREVVEELQRQGHEVTVVTAISPRFLQQLAWAGRIAVRQVPILNLPGCRHLSFVIALMGCLLWWCLRRRPDALYERFSLTTIGTLLVSRLARIPLVVEVNGIIRDELALGRASRWRLRLQDWVERRVFRGCARIVAVTEGIRQWIAETYAVPPARIEAIPNGTNPERFKPLDRVEARRVLGLDPTQPIVGYLGSLFPWCGLETLVEASPRVAAEVPNVLFLIGGGQEDLRQRLEAQARRLGMAERFRFTGDVPWEQAARFISAFDVAVAPARFANARSGISPQKVYAYLACERPVVGSDLDGLGDVLVNEGVGLSFPAGEAAALARAIIQLLTDPPRAKEMGQRGRRLVLVRYTWEQVVTRTLRMFADIAKGHAGGQPPVPPEVYRREYYLRDREGSAEFVESRGHRLCAQHAEALKLADIREGHHVLDVGCGCGELAIHAALRGAKTIGIDYAPAAVELAKEALGTFPPDVQARVRLILASAEEPVLEKVDPESIDRIFLMDVLEHLYPWQIERLYARLFRILKPGGRMICHTWPNRWHTTCVYPLVARASRLFGVEKSEHVRAAHDEVMHVNEQTPWGVWRDATRAGFRVKIWMAHESSAASNRCVRWLYDAVHRTPPCGFAFGDDIWCVATRKS